MNRPPAAVGDGGKLTDGGPVGERRGEDPAGSGVTIEVFTRGSMEARERAESVVERLRDLKAAGRIEGVDVHTWPGEVSIRTGTLVGLVDTFERFEAWARGRGVSIRPPFAVRDRHSTITQETDTLLVTPVVCLAAFDADELVGVYPCTDGESVTSIDDFLEQLATQEEARPITIPAGNTPDAGLTGSSMTDTEDE